MKCLAQGINHRMQDLSPLGHQLKNENNLDKVYKLQMQPTKHFYFCDYNVQCNGQQLIVNIATKYKQMTLSCLLL